MVSLLSLSWSISSFPNSATTSSPSSNIQDLPPHPSLCPIDHMSIWTKPFASWMTAGQSQSPSYTFTLQGLFSPLSHTPEVSLPSPLLSLFTHPSSSSTYFLPKECVLCKAFQGKRLVLIFAPGKCIWEAGAGVYGKLDAGKSIKCYSPLTAGKEVENGEI